MNNKDLFDIQESLYTFPYHYLPTIHHGTVIRLHQQLKWGLEYMTYLSFIVDIIRQYEIESLCDIGCGDGRLINMIKQFIPNITGVDISEQALAFARAFNPGINFLCEDIRNLSGSYEWITLVEVLEHIPDADVTKIISNIARLIKDDGTLLITVPTINVPKNEKHYRHYTYQLLNETIRPFFEIRNCWWLYRYNIITRAMRVFLCNKLYSLNFEPILKFVWRFHQHHTYFASERNGAHLICLATRN
jgi:SAM-dependent methyltransferase